MATTLLHFTCEFNPRMGGIPSGIQITVKNLRDFEIDADVASLGNSYASSRAGKSRIQEIASQGSKVVCTPSWFTNSYGIGWNFGFLKRLSVPSVYSVVVLHQVYTLSTLIGYRYSKKNRIPYVVFPHGSLTHYHESDSKLIKGAARRLIIKKILREAGAIIVTCVSEKMDLEVGLQPKAILLPYGAEIGNLLLDIKNKTGGDSKITRILFSGRFDKKKNLPMLLKALPGILSKYPNLVLDIAGSGTTKEIRNLKTIIATLELENNIEFHGWVDRSEMEQLFRSASLLVLPSENENFAQVVSEALSSGVPCVVSQFVGTSDIVARHHAGEIIEELTPESVAAAVLKVLEGDQLAYREAAFKATREDLDWSKIALKWKAMIGSLVVE